MNNIRQFFTVGGYLLLWSGVAGGCNENLGLATTPISMSAQAVVRHRARMNGLAAQGHYTPELEKAA